MDHPHTNALANESSPYLLQHAHNPVDWFPWGEEALQKAREEKKLLVVSIGYSSCHWCHVMEYESFEDTNVAKLMNDHFVSIKVDREERPDIDHIYMTVVHMMNQQGGWPLNCIALPDGRPIWGGTYLPREQWLNILSQVNAYHHEHPEETEQYASQLAEGLRRNSLFHGEQGIHPLDGSGLRTAVENWSGQFDGVYGGMEGAPKFPMPVNLAFLLHYGYQYGDKAVLGFVEKTLIKMARGGIYDQAGGGFSRYSVDRIWKVPHFEKMLYDNAQLVGLYAEGFQVYGNENFLMVLEQSVEFLEREMMGPDGMFFSALDADSDGEEGKFYTWTREELESLLKGDFDLFAAYYNINTTGLWEHGSYILYRTSDPGSFASERSLGKDIFIEKIRSWNKILLEARSKRVRPGLDDKSLTSWNSMMISGLVTVYRATGHPKYLQLASRCAITIREKIWDGEKVLYRNYKNGRRSIPGFHIDYALYTRACLDLFETSLDASWLELASILTARTLDLFYDQGSGMFHYSASGSEVLITHHAETQDNVIPSSNSVMAHNLFRMGHLLTNREYLERSESMVNGISDRIGQYPNGYAGWGRMWLMLNNPFYEIAVTGPDAKGVVEKLSKDYIPNAILAGSVTESDLPLFRDRFLNDKTHIFVCRDNVCQLPLENPDDAKAICHIR
ncbi:MAG: thioredoxin domain-containing protein [Bacteroidota bacterium]